MNKDDIAGGRGIDYGPTVSVKLLIKDRGLVKFFREIYGIPLFLCEMDIKKCLQENGFDIEKTAVELKKKSPIPQWITYSRVRK